MVTSEIAERESGKVSEALASGLDTTVEPTIDATDRQVGHWTLITPYFWPQVGGVQQYVAMICRALGPSNVTIIGPKLRAAHWLHPDDMSLSTFTIRRPIADRLRMAHTAIVAFWETRHHSGGIIIGVLRPQALSVIALKRLFAVPYIVCCHGKELVTDSTYRRWTNRLLLSRADRVIANSMFTASLAIRSGAHQASIEILRPALRAWPACDNPDERCEALRDEHRLRDRRIMLTVGRLIDRKGHDLTLRSLKSLLDTGEHVCYVIVGDGPERARLERLATDLGVIEAVVFTGRVSEEDIAAWYHLADIFVMVSRSDTRDIEGFGIVYLEAAAAGKPVIAGHGGGVEDALIDGVTGLLVDPTSEPDLTQTLQYLLHSPSTAIAMGQAGKTWVTTMMNEQTFSTRLRLILQSTVRQGTRPTWE